jgi:hypothetical protein
VALSLAAFAIAFGLLLLETLFGGSLAIEGSSRLGIVLLVLLAFAGVPRAAGGSGAVVELFAWMLPLLLLGAGLDLGSGASRSAVASAGIQGILLAFLWGHAAERARRGWARTYAVMWCFLVPLASALAFAEAATPPLAETSRSGIGARLAWLDPLAFAVRVTRDGGLEGPLFVAAGALLAAVAMLALTYMPRRSAEQRT